MNIPNAFGLKSGGRGSG